MVVAVAEPVSGDGSVASGAGAGTGVPASLRAFFTSAEPSLYQSM